MRIGEFGDFSGGPSDTAANIKNLHSSLDTDLGSKVVLVASDGLIEGLARGVAAEVEALAPAILVQVGGEVVVAEVKCVSNVLRAK